MKDNEKCAKHIWYFLYHPGQPVDGVAVRGTTQIPSMGSTHSSTSSWRTGYQWLWARELPCLRMQTLSRDGLPPVTGVQGYKGPAPLTQFGTTQKGHPRSKISNRICWGLSFSFPLCPMLPSLFPCRCSSQIHTSISLLDAIFYFRIWLKGTQSKAM